MSDVSNQWNSRDKTCLVRSRSPITITFTITITITFTFTFKSPITITITFTVPECKPQASINDKP